MNTETRLELSYYREIGVINESHRIYLVQHVETHKVYVKKILSAYNYDIYAHLMTFPVPGLPQIYCLHEENNTLTVIEEYISGNTVEELLSKNGAFPEVSVEIYISQLCEILKRIHSLNPPIVHRDIKPSNVMITPEGQSILLDLNAARLEITKQEDTVLLGTHGYSAPEQYGFGSSTTSADIYALGMLMNTMLWGEFNKTIYPNSKLTSIIKRCTEINPADRYPNIDKVASAIEAKRSKTIKKYRRYLPPGFRSGNPYHALIAIPVYLFFSWVTLTLETKNVGAALKFERISTFIMVMATIAAANDYMGFQRLFPLCYSPKRWVRIIAKILFTVIVFFFGLGTTIVIESFLFHT